MMSKEKNVRSKLCHRKVLIVGLAREGTALAPFLAQLGAEITVTDLKSEAALQDSLADLAGLPIRYVLGHHPETLLDTDLLFLSPGVPLNAPFIQQARRRHVAISSEPRLFSELCPAPIVGITGSSGKTTTTTLVAEMCRAAGRDTYLGGNIGRPLINELDEIKATDAVVMELSSFQLDLYGDWPPNTRHRDTWSELAKGYSPAIAAILNITPNHLDRHGTMQAYTSAKANILAFQGDNDHAILNADDPITRQLGAQAHGHTSWFSLERPVESGAFLDGETLMLAQSGNAQPICSIDDLRLPGQHNVANVLAACAIAAQAQIPPQRMAQIAATFAGVEHRLETVRIIDGVRYVNDSIATSPERAMAALRSYTAPVILLAGGRDKHLPWGAWAKLVAERVKHVLLFGEAADLIAQAAADAWGDRMDRPTMERCGTMDRALKRASQLAVTGDIVLLSPGGTSYDAYVDFAERGLAFRALVATL